MPRPADLTQSRVAGATAPASAGPVAVVAGVLTDARGRILLARRTADRDLAGAWEFPGGKVEIGESPFQALDRELHEELGIRIHSMEPLIRVGQASAHKRILLDVYTVTRFSGKPHGREQQALAWSPLEKLATYPMPPADRPVVAALTRPAQYLITPPVVGDPARFLRQLEAALSAGIRLVQLRVEAGELEAVAAMARKLCHSAGAHLLVNGDIELARQLQCGVHLKSSQLRALAERPLPAGQAVAASCHDRAELEMAQALGVDFVVLGPVADTGSHPGKPVLGWRRFAELREHCSLPIYALGGMQPGDHGVARQNGAQGIAGITALWPRAVG